MSMPIHNVLAMVIYLMKLHKFTLIRNAKIVKSHFLKMREQSEGLLVKRSTVSHVL
jgi:hypothetical protein